MFVKNIHQIYATLYDNMSMPIAKLTCWSATQAIHLLATTSASETMTTAYLVLQVPIT